MQKAIPIQGSNFLDNRGEIKFFNSFDMVPIIRFYEIAPSSTDIIRAWQGHKLEKKWFYCHSGSFVVNIVNIMDNGVSIADKSPERFELKAEVPLILMVPSGNATGFKALLPHSKLMVFSNFTLEESSKDDIRFPIETWNAVW